MSSEEAWGTQTLMHEWKVAYYSATNPGGATKVLFVAIKQHWQDFQPTTKTDLHL